MTNVYVGVLRVQGRLTAAALLMLAIGLGTLVISWLLLPVIGISAVGCAFLAMQLCGCVYVALDRRRQASPQQVQSAPSGDPVRSWHRFLPFTQSRSDAVSGRSTVARVPGVERSVAALGSGTVRDRHDDRPNDGQGETLLPTVRRPLTPRESHSRAHYALGWVVSIALSSAVGLGALALADEASRRGNASVPTYQLYWLGLLLIFAPVALRALARDVDRRERLSLIIILGVSLYLAKVLASPHAFTFVDEYIHVRNAQDILGSNHLFTWNPLLPTAPYYPGLAALTAGLVDLTGLSVFTAGLLVIGIARVLFCACFYLVAERITGCGRGAAAASLVYAANPMFLFWSSTFAYENLALPLAAFVVWWIARTRKRGNLASMVVAVLGVGAVTVTHHVVGFALSALLGGWWFAERVGCDSTRAARRQVGIMALLAASAALTWFFVLARPAPSYLLTNNLFPALRGMGSLVLGHAAPRKLYTSGGFVPPAWEPVAGFAAIVVLLLALLCRPSSRLVVSSAGACGRCHDLGGGLPAQPGAATHSERCRHIGTVLGVRLRRPGLCHRAALHRGSIEGRHQAHVPARPS